MAKAAAVVAVLALATVLAIAGLTWAGLQPHNQADNAEFCFAEWCVKPAAVTVTGSRTDVQVNVRSAALSATQRPDHPQAWLDDGHGRKVGGPQSKLDGEVGPGQQYSTDLAFTVTAPRCATFSVSEGAWPSFLGLGYRPSPFTETAAWRLCT